MKPSIAEYRFESHLKRYADRFGLSPHGLARIAHFPEPVLSTVFNNAEKKANNGQLDRPMGYILSALRAGCRERTLEPNYSLAGTLQRDYEIPPTMKEVDHESPCLFNDVTGPKPRSQQTAGVQYDREAPDYRDDYDRNREATDLIAKMRAMEPAQAAVHFRGAQQFGLLNLLVDEWPDDMQAIIERV